MVQKKYYNSIRYFLIVLSIIGLGFNKVDAQVNATNSDKLTSEAYSEMVEKYVEESVPLITIEEYQKNIEAYILLDAREKNEFDISHIKNAKHIGYNRPNYKVIDNEGKDKPIVIYCSIGYRSEKIGEKLQKKGYTVYNLYGSIFEWANLGLELFDKNGELTQKIHGYNKNWSKWVTHPELKVSY